jgi:hypothetical protein
MDYKYLMKLLYIHGFIFDFLIFNFAFWRNLASEKRFCAHTHQKSFSAVIFFHWQNFAKILTWKTWYQRLFFREKRPKFARLNDKFHEVVKYIYIWYVAKKILYDHCLGYIKTRDVSHCCLAIHMRKTLGKRRIMETQIFHHAKI